MSERLAPANHETHEALPAPERHEALPAHAETAKAETFEQRAERLSEARSEAHAQAEQAAVGVERLHAAEQDTPAVGIPGRINRELKQITLRRELQMIRRHLPAPQRALSRVVHQPVIRAVSEASSQTISRPSGLLGGGLTAFIGTSVYLYLARHIGFNYNYSIALLLFAAGFVFGLVLEFFVFAATRRSKE